MRLIERDGCSIEPYIEEDISCALYANRGHTVRLAPKGIFIAQDGANTQKKDTLHQNFKIVDWRKIDASLSLD